MPTSCLQAGMLAKQERPEVLLRKRCTKLAGAEYAYAVQCAQTSRRLLIDAKSRIPFWEFERANLNLQKEQQAVLKACSASDWMYCC